MAKREQVFYGLAGTHFFPLPGDAGELEMKNSQVLQ